jgi:hypothetical protein
VIRRWGAVPALALALAACGGEAPEAPEDRPRQIRVANPHNDALANLSEPMRNLALMRALRDNGRRCQRVERAAYQEEHRGLAMWTAMCNDGRQWAIFIAPNADIQVRLCEEAGQLGLPPCRLLPPPPNAAG